MRDAFDALRQGLETRGRVSTRRRRFGTHLNLPFVWALFCCGQNLPYIGNTIRGKAFVSKTIFETISELGSPPLTARWRRLRWPRLFGDFVEGQITLEQSDRTCSVLLRLFLNRVRTG